VTELFVKEAFAMLLSVLVEPLIDLFVSVCAPVKVATVESIASPNANSNTAIGYTALYSNIASSLNTAIGYGSAYSNTTGRVTAVGYNAAQANTTAVSTAVGYAALATNTTGDGNTAIGDQSLNANTTGGNNAAVGYVSLRINSTGQANSAFGQASLYTNTTGSYNTGIGNGALFSSTTASYNTAIGFQSGYSNTTGNQFVAIGNQAAYSQTTGTNNTAVGFAALYSNQTGTDNTAVGNYSQYPTTGTANITLAGPQRWGTVTNKVAAGGSPVIRQLNGRVGAFRTAARGSGTLNAATTATSVTFATALDVSPQAADVQLNLTSNPGGSVGSIWITNVTTTGFTLNASVAPISNTNFAYYVDAT